MSLVMTEKRNYMTLMIMTNVGSVISRPNLYLELIKSWMQLMYFPTRALHPIYNRDLTTAIYGSPVDEKYFFPLPNVDKLSD